MHSIENLTALETETAEPEGVPKRSMLRWGQRCVSILLTGLSWLAVVPLALLAVARIVAPDHTLLLLWLNSFTEYLYLPVYPALAWAVASRRRGLMLAALLPVIAHLVWLVPSYRPAAAQPFDVQHASRLRIASGNALASNQSLADWLNELRQTDPDVLLIQELSHELVTVIERSGLPVDMPYHAMTPQRGWPGMAVYSKYPLDDLELIKIGAAPLMVFTITYETQRLRVYHIHNMAPMKERQWQMWREYWQHVCDRLATETLPRLLIGDFNTTQHAQCYRDLLTAGLRSAHADRGRGSAKTWPNGKAALIPPIRIDHALLSSGLACLKIEEGEGSGSDHRPLFIELAIPQAADANTR